MHECCIYNGQQPQEHQHYGDPQQRATPFRHERAQLVGAITRFGGGNVAHIPNDAMTMIISTTLSQSLK